MAPDPTPDDVTVLVFLSLDTCICMSSSRLALSASSEYKSTGGGGGGGMSIIIGEPLPWEPEPGDVAYDAPIDREDAPSCCCWPGGGMSVLRRRDWSVG